jgi:hypothetical protein
VYWLWWRKNHWCSCGIAHITFLLWLAQINICLQVIVLEVVRSSNFIWIVQFLALQIEVISWNLLITLDINFQASLKGYGRGRLHLDICRLSKWQMLSYTNSGVGDSDLKKCFLIGSFKFSLTNQRKCFIL